MPSFVYYLFKVILCSGILYAYYFIALRNRGFHTWNRFYLLAAVVLSIIAPLVTVTIHQKAGAHEMQVIHFLRLVNTGEDFVDAYTGKPYSVRVNAWDMAAMAYVIICAIFLVSFIRALQTIHLLKAKHPHRVERGYVLIHTDAKSTPFSFFNTIFWNHKIDIHGPTGKQIFQHELAHVTGKHSFDKVCMRIFLSIFWCNPFFWLISKELNMVHEFIADSKALKNGDAASFAMMILSSGYPRQQFGISSYFFYSPLKRRLIMLTTNKIPKIRLFSRSLALLLATLVFFSFTLRMKSPPLLYTGGKISVVIDAGHGGSDDGAIGKNGINEKDVTLSIARQIKVLNGNKNLNIILLRDKDETIGVKQRVDMARSLAADLYISIHIDVDLTQNGHSGLGLLVPGNDNPYIKESRLLGSRILESFKDTYPLNVSDELKQSKKGIWVLKANHCPAVIIQAGFINNQKDLAYLVKEKSQQAIALNILNGIEKYAQQNLSGK